MATYNITNSLTNITTGNITVTLLADQAIVDKYNFDKFGLYNSCYDSSD